MVACIALFIVTISEAKFITENNINSVLEYFGYGLLLLSVIWFFINNRKIKDKIDDFFFFLIFALLTGVGLWFQDISIVRFFILQFTVLGIAIISTLSGGYLKSYDDIRKIVYSITAGMIFSFFIGIVSGVGVCEAAADGILGIKMGLNGGMVYKNYFAADMIVIILGLYICGKENRFKNIDYVIMAVAFIALLLSNSRGGLIILLSFFVACNYKLIYRIKKIYRKILIAFLVTTIVIVVIVVFSKIVLGFATFAYRFRGLINYLKYFEKDYFHMFLGNVESFYDKDLSYVMAVRSTTGFDGSLEMAWLNILIKSGLCGVCGYILLFIRYFRFTKLQKAKSASIVVAIVVALLVSSFVEAYIQIVHSVFAIFLYLIVNSINSIDVQSLKSDCLEV